MWTSPLGVTIDLSTGLRHTAFPGVRETILKPVVSQGILPPHTHWEIRSMSWPGKTRLTSVLRLAIGVTRPQPQIKLVDIAVALEASVAAIGQAVDIASVRCEGNLISRITSLCDRGQRAVNFTDLTARLSLSALVGGNPQGRLSLAWDPSITCSDKGQPFTGHI